VTTTFTPVGTTPAARLRRLRQIATEVLQLEPGELTDTSDFVDEHQADSLLAVEILVRVETDLGISVPMHQVAAMTDLSALYRIVADQAGWEPATVRRIPA
jgi:acyl carrier protein